MAYLSEANSQRDYAYRVARGIAGSTKAEMMNSCDKPGMWIPYDKIFASRMRAAARNGGEHIGER